MNTRPRFALHRVEYRQTYASLSTKTRPSPFPLHRVVYRSRPMLHSTRNLWIMIPIYIIHMITSRSTISSVARKFLTTLTCEVIVNGSPLTINTNFMTVNLQVITRNKPCTDDGCCFFILFFIHTHKPKKNSDCFCCYYAGCGARGESR